ncbi:roadblock/LC7 domain-containing protein [Actinomadura sp. 7K507]|uniref:roadblock/LC7 domain-containing protein n=1 Tax=Actinomadura sp. 7K507 TaxID=2530365 RepID=UPI0014055444|nr:roadblock/LC7 domain-containing protein [Actinomadura sp. 7K507]
MRQDLGWLLDNFRAEVTGTQAAFLLGRDGLVLAVSGLTTDEADVAAAVSAALYSAAAASGKITSLQDDDVQQVVVERNAGYTILMRTPGQHPDAPADRGTGAAGDLTAPQAERAVVGCVLGVLAEPDAHTGLVANGMATLIGSVARHLGTATRPSTPSTDTLFTPENSSNAPVEAAGENGGSGDEQ